jgi:exosortase E/protease (VPEID-CTERM system)
MGARPLAGGLVVGALAWLSGLAAQGLWPWLSAATLNATASVMRPLAGERLFVDMDRRLLGLGDFLAEIGAPCSGAEGMGLVGVLGMAYLVKFRSALAFPRALLVVPAAMLLSFGGNVVRLVALVWLGDAVSPEIAVQGFHSKAGWVLTCAIAIGVLAWVRRSRWLARHPTALHTPTGDNPTALYLAPLLASSALLLATGLFTAGFDRFYWARVLGTAVALVTCRSAFAGTAGRPPVTALTLAAGAVVLAAWLAIARRADPGELAGVQAGLAALSPAARAGWLVVRALGAVVIAPLTEELAFRGYLLRRLVRDDFWDVDLAAAARHPVAVPVSALVFGALHGSFVAGTIAGLAYALVLRRRGRLMDAVVAHATTNALLFGYTVVTGDWSFLA